MDRKLQSELNYWKRVASSLKAKYGMGEGPYGSRFLAMAEEPDQGFVRGKIVADFGCGPRGSLRWATDARLRIGLDVLAADYHREFDVRSHDMVYVVCGEHSIPLPSAYVDVMLTLNAMDHCSDFEASMDELARVTVQGGLLVASFNLLHEQNVAHPSRLTPKRVTAALEEHWEVERSRTAMESKKGSAYRHFEDGVRKEWDGKGRGFMWVRAKRR